jgi:hypothetical protein
MNDLIQFYGVLEEGRVRGEPDFDQSIWRWHGSDDLVAKIE